MAAYYNEFDPYAAQWLRNLIQKGLIAGGEVDDRSIEEVSADDLRGFTQAHFFAGIGGWSLAARLAGWPDDRPLWTGSCPCQPFSTAGQRKGESDERHLWPAFHSLIDQLRPPAICGEQVSSRLGYRWLSGVRADLEASGYAVGAIDLCAASVGAPHIRQRLWWMAYAGRSSDEFGSGLGDAQTAPRKAQGEAQKRERSGPDPWGGSRSSGVAYPQGAGRQAWGSDGIRNDRAPESSPAASYGGGSDRMADSECERYEGRERIGSSGAERESSGHFSERREIGGMADAQDSGFPRQEPGRWEEGGELDRRGFWMGRWIDCADGKARRIEPSTEPLAHGIPNRVGRLRAYGNAIVPQVGAEIIRAMMEVRP